MGVWGILEQRGGLQEQVLRLAQEIPLLGEDGLRADVYSIEHCEPGRPLCGVTVDQHHCRIKLCAQRVPRGRIPQLVEEVGGFRMYLLLRRSACDRM